MYSHFESLSEKKQRRILNASFREFGKYGYKKTSVEQLARSAEIAKGMIFHYFGSKRGLFEYLFDYAYRYIMKYFGPIESQLPDLDYIEQYRLVTKTKLKAYTENPYVFEFYSVVFFHAENLDVSEKVKTLYLKTLDFRNGSFEAIRKTENTTCFRDDIDIEKAKNYIAWLIDGYSQALLLKLGGKPLADMDTEPYWNEVDEILNDMKRLFYKSECQEKKEF